MAGEESHMEKGMGDSEVVCRTGEGVNICVGTGEGTRRGSAMKIIVGEKRVFYHAAWGDICE